MDDLLVLDLEKWFWFRLNPMGIKPNTYPKYGHSFSEYQNKIILFGGITYIQKEAGYKRNRSRTFHFNKFHILDLGTYARDISYLFDQN